MGSITATRAPIFAQAARANIRYVGVIPARGDGQAIIVSDASPAKALSDLKSKKVGVANIEISFLRAIAGLVVGGGIGLALGLANGLSRLSENLTDSTLQMIRNVPHLALIPLVIVWFGIDEGAKLFLVALGVFFPFYINTLHGVRSVDPQLIEMGRNYGMSNTALFRSVILPGALPSIFVGLRYALGVMWLTLIVAETIAAQSAIGYMAMQAREFMMTDVVVLSILIYALLGKLADVIARSLERACLPWHPAYKRGY